MGKNAYQPKGEGAIYPKRRVLTGDEARAAVDAPRRDEVATAQQLAVEVLSHFYGADVALVGRHEDPAINGEPLSYPRFGEHPEIVSDAFEVLDLAHSVNTLGKIVNDERFADCDPVGSLVGAAVMLGRMTERLAMRWEGFEASVGSRNRQVAALPKGSGRIDIDPDGLRVEWDRAKRMKPHADKNTLRNLVAGRLLTSAATIKRRLSEHGIDPPPKKT